MASIRNGSYVEIQQGNLGGNGVWDLFAARMTFLSGVSVGGGETIALETGSVFQTNSPTYFHAALDLNQPGYEVIFSGLTGVDSYSFKGGHLALWSGPNKVAQYSVNAAPGVTMSVHSDGSSVYVTDTGAVATAVPIHS